MCDLCGEDDVWVVQIHSLYVLNLSSTWLPVVTLTLLSLYHVPMEEMAE